MKAFIFVALVACVAARGVDLDTLRLVRERSLNRPLVEDLLKERLTQRVPLQRTVGDVIDRVPVEREQFQGQGIRGLQGRVQGVYDVDQVLTLEELYTTQLFRQYLQIPLFRQYIQYPVFQRYVASVYFQRFWQISGFTQYFVNPVLFYQYVYPIVQLFQNEYHLPIHQQQIGQQGIVGRQTLDDLIIRNRNVLPYVYGRGFPFVARQNPYTNHRVNYNYILNRLYNQLVNQQGVQDVQVRTDIRLLPEQEVVVDPITGERKVVVEPRIFDVQVQEQVVPQQTVAPTQQILPVEQPIDTIVGRDQVIREQLIRELIRPGYLTPELIRQIRDLPTIRREERQQIRDILGEQYLTPEVTRQLRDLPTIRREERQQIRDILGEQYLTPEVIRQLRDLPTIRREEPQQIRDILGEQYLTPEVIRQLRDLPTIRREEPQQIRDILGEQYLTPEVIRQLRELPTTRQEGQQVLDLVNQLVARRQQGIVTPQVNTELPLVQDTRVPQHVIGQVVV